MKIIAVNITKGGGKVLLDLLMKELLKLNYSATIYVNKQFNISKYDSNKNLKFIQVKIIYLIYFFF